MIPNELSLFSGIGCGIWGSKYILGWRTIGYVEIEKYCCQVLEARIKDGSFDAAPVFNMDIRDFNARVAPMYRGVVDVLSGGPPCQSFSLAGRRKGKDDARDCWPAFLESIRIIRPRYMFAENVPGLLADGGYFGRILGQLSELGYDARWGVLSAAAVGAPHLRKRVWIVAEDTERKRCEDISETRAEKGRLRDLGAEDGDRVRLESTSDSYSTGLERQRSCGHEQAHAMPEWPDWSEPWPEVAQRFCQLDDGSANRSQRLRAIGNGQCPQQLAEAWRRLTR